MVKTHLCYYCNKNIGFNQHKNFYFNGKKQNVYILCLECFDSNKYLELSKIPSMYNINDVKIFYVEKKLYIEKIEEKYLLRKNNLKLKRDGRRDLLMKKIKDMKLDYNKNICDSYIKFGTTELNDVISMLYNRQIEKNNNLCTLLNELRNRNLEYDDKIPSYKKFLKSGKNLNKTIEDAELEKILIAETDYLSIADDINSDTAKEISLNVFYKKGKKNNIVDNYVINKNTLKFE